MKKSLLGLALASLVSGSAIASPVYINNGFDFGGNANTAAGATTTGWFDEMTYTYFSSSVITDEDGSDSLSVGDTIFSTGGVLGAGFPGFPSGLTVNNVTGFNPGEVGAIGPSENGYGSWGLTLGFDDIQGTWNGAGFDYSAGSLSVYYYEGAPTSIGDLTRLFDLEISAGGDTGTATAFIGNIGNVNTTDTINGVVAGDVFNIALGPDAVSQYVFGAPAPSSTQTFTEVADEAASGDVVFTFFASQDTVPLSGLTFVNGQAVTAGSHDGSISFNIPEPSTIAVMGLGLLGLAGASRKRKA